MKLDLVHDIQKVYKKVLYSISRPGLISSLKDEALNMDLDFNCYRSTSILILMLLDTEVTFTVFSESKKEITKYINNLTYSKYASVDKADFIFVLNNALPSDLVISIEKSNPGTLLNPHKSATIICEVADISYENELVLKGPGIENEKYVKISGIQEWIDARNIKNKEFPLGVDIIFIDANYNLICLPRTTIIDKAVV